MKFARCDIVLRGVFSIVRNFVVVLCLGTSAVVALAEPRLDSEANIQHAVRQAVDEYVDGGMIGLRIQVKQCYAQLPSMGLGKKLSEQQGVDALRVLQFCASLDWASFVLDDAAVQKMHWPSTSFFTKAATQKRIRDQLKPLINVANDRAIFQKVLSQQVEAALVQQIQTVETPKKSST